MVNKTYKTDKRRIKNVLCVDCGKVFKRMLNTEYSLLRSKNSFKGFCSECGEKRISRIRGCSK